MNKALKADFLLLTTAILWGAAFVAQREATNYLPPMLFNGIRFGLGSLALLPLVFRFESRTEIPERISGEKSKLFESVGILLAGMILFGGASLQQVGIIHTTAGKAGFITGLYVVLVPVIGLFLGQRADFKAWIGAVLAVVGLYYLSINESMEMNKGDFLIFIGAFLWAGHVSLLGYLASKINPVKLACGQAAVCSVLSLAAACLTEKISFNWPPMAWAAILYGGFISVGIAYTLQVVAQKDANPTHASIILSLETVFAAIAGRILLNEILSDRAIIGCVLMFIGFTVSQLGPVKKEDKMVGHEMR